MATKLVTETKKRLTAWYKKTTKVTPISISHIHPRAYVVGKAGGLCLVVATPWVDSEKQVRDFDKENGLKTIRMFDKSLKAGDWCSAGYVSTASVGETIAIPVVEG